MAARKNEQRMSARLQLVLRGYLQTSTPMRYGATVAQIKATAKQLQKSGLIPAPVAAYLTQGVV